MDSPDDPVFEADFDAVRVCRALCEDIEDDALRESPAFLILLLHNPDFHAASDLFPDRSSHADRLPSGLISKV